MCAYFGLVRIAVTEGPVDAVQCEALFEITRHTDVAPPRLSPRECRFAQNCRAVVKLVQKEISAIVGLPASRVADAGARFPS
jgi:hypothetical protein